MNNNIIPNNNLVSNNNTVPNNNLVPNNNIVSKPKMILNNVFIENIESINIKLKNIFIYENFIQYKNIKIEKHVYYVSLVIRNSQLYNSYVNITERQKNKPTGTFVGFIELLENIKKNGFDFLNNDKIVIKKINNQYSCLHGRHRMCIMKYLYGENTTLIIKKNKVIGIIK